MNCHQGWKKEKMMSKIVRHFSKEDNENFFNKDKIQKNPNNARNDVERMSGRKDSRVVTKMRCRLLVSSTFFSPIRLLFVYASIWYCAGGKEIIFSFVFTTGCPSRMT
jgi:hypothetical protein